MDVQRAIKFKLNSKIKNMVLIGSEIGKLPHKLLYCLKLSDFFSPWYNSHFQVPGRYNVFGQ